MLLIIQPVESPSHLGSSVSQNRERRYSFRFSRMNRLTLENKNRRQQENVDAEIA